MIAVYTNITDIVANILMVGSGLLLVLLFCYYICIGIDTRVTQKKKKEKINKK